MFQDNFQHDTIRKYYTYFGALFSNVNIDREVNGELAARFKVPLHFAKMEHALERVQEDPGDTRAEAIVLPAMSFDLVDMKYAGSRKQPTRNRFAVPLTTNANAFGVMHVPVPYDFHFQLSILVKNINDGLKIIEGILPYFTPDYTAQLELIPEMGVTVEIPLVLEQSAMDYEVPKDYKTRVTYMWVLDFSLQGYLYGPEKSWPVIKFANVSFFVDSGNGYNSNTNVLVVTSQPGLTANGEPTSDPTETVPYLTISVTDNYGYIDQANTIIGNRERS